MSTRKDSRKKATSGTHEIPRDQLVEVYRQNTMRTLRDVRKGMVNELDLDKIQNFVQTSLALMQIVSVDTFRHAQRNAELLGFFKGGDAQVVLDPKKQRQDIPVLDLNLDLDMDSVVKQAVHDLEQEQQP